MSVLHARWPWAESKYNFRVMNEATRQHIPSKTHYEKKVQVSIVIGKISPLINLASMISLFPPPAPSGRGHHTCFEHRSVVEGSSVTSASRTKLARTIWSRHGAVNTSH